MNGLKIIATGYYPGEKVVTNMDFEKKIDTTDEWITTRTGIKRRHFSENSSAMLAIEAAFQATRNIDVSRIGIIICATMTPENATPSNACLVQEALGLNEQTVMCFDINAACSGFVYAMEVARALLLNKSQYALIIGCEQLSRILDFQDRTTCILFGDGAGAVIVKSSQQLFISYNDACGNPIPLLASYEKEDNYLHMQGQEVFKFATKVIIKSIEKVLDEANISLNEIDYIVCHQANLRIIQYVYKKLKCAPDKFFVNLDEFGNTSAASIPMALAQMNEHSLLKRGMKIICVGFGGGLTWGATLMEW